MKNLVQSLSGFRRTIPPLLRTSMLSGRNIPVSAPITTVRSRHSEAEAALGRPIVATTPLSYNATIVRALEEDDHNRLLRLDPEAEDRHVVWPFNTKPTDMRVTRTQFLILSGNFAITYPGGKIPSYITVGIPGECSVELTHAKLEEILKNPYPHMLSRTFSPQELPPSLDESIWVAHRSTLRKSTPKITVHQNFVVAQLGKPPLARGERESQDAFCKRLAVFTLRSDTGLEIVAAEDLPEPYRTIVMTGTTLTAETRAALDDELPSLITTAAPEIEAYLTRIVIQHEKEGQYCTPDFPIAILPQIVQFCTPETLATALSLSQGKFPLHFDLYSGLLKGAVENNARPETLSLLAQLVFEQASTEQRQGDLESVFSSVTALCAIKRNFRFLEQLMVKAEIAGHCNIQTQCEAGLKAATAPSSVLTDTCSILPAITLESYLTT